MSGNCQMSSREMKSTDSPVGSQNRCCELLQRKHNSISENMTIHKHKDISENMTIQKTQQHFRNTTAFQKTQHFKKHFLILIGQNLSWHDIPINCVFWNVYVFSVLFFFCFLKSSVSCTLIVFCEMLLCFDLNDQHGNMIIVGEKDRMQERIRWRQMTCWGVPRRFWQNDVMKRKCDWN